MISRDVSSVDKAPLTELGFGPIGKQGLRLSVTLLALHLKSNYARRDSLMLGLAVIPGLAIELAVLNTLNAQSVPTLYTMQKILLSEYFPS